MYAKPKSKSFLLILKGGRAQVQGLCVGILVSVTIYGELSREE